MNLVLEKLAANYPLLYLDPDKDTQETYRFVVLQGGDPPAHQLDHYHGSASDGLETLGTPVGPVQVLTLGDRRDFELVMRGFMAAKDGPLANIPASQGSALLTVFNWPRIKAHLAAFPEEERDAEFRRFTSVKENFIDMLVVLSRGPYSDIDARSAGHTEEEWLALSDIIRRYHELTHLICRRLYPDRIDPVGDELIADAVGLYAAYGSFDPEKEMLFLGIKDGSYSSGRLGNYTDEPEKETGRVCEEIARIKKCIESHPGAQPFDLITLLMEK